MRSSSAAGGGQVPTGPTILLLMPLLTIDRNPFAMADQTQTVDPPAPLDTRFLIDQARGYLAFGDQVAAMCQQFQGASEQGADWGAMLRENFAQFKTAITQSAEDPNVNPELARLWNQTLDLWQQTATALGFVPPASGENSAWQAYREVQNQYLDMLRNAAKGALDLMEKQLTERADNHQMISSLRELYNLWVDCNEKTYGQMLRGSAYAELSGRLFNSLLACSPKRENTP